MHPHGMTPASYRGMAFTLQYAVHGQHKLQDVSSANFMLMEVIAGIPPEVHWQNDGSSQANGHNAGCRIQDDAQLQAANCVNISATEHSDI